MFTDKNFTYCNLGVYRQNVENGVEKLETFIRPRGLSLEFVHFGDFYSNAQGKIDDLVISKINVKTLFLVIFTATRFDATGPSSG